MKKIKCLSSLTAGLLLALCFSGCAPQGAVGSKADEISVKITNTDNVYVDELINSGFNMQVEVKNAEDKRVNFEVKEEGSYVTVSNDGFVTLKENTPEWHNFTVKAVSVQNSNKYDEADFTVIETRGIMSGTGQIGQIIASVNGDPSTARGISWFTTGDIEESDLWLSTKPDMSDASLYLGLSNTFSKYATDSDKDYGLEKQAYYNHKVTLKNLQPDTTYYYKVGSQKLSIYSDICSFKTTASENYTANVFITTDVHYGSREGVSAKYYHTALSDAIERFGVIDVALDCGDFKSQWKVGTGYYYFEEEWVKTMASISPLLRTTTFAPLDGNHDNKRGSGYGEFDYAFYNHYNVPASPVEINDGQITGLNYSFDIGDAHIVMLSYTEKSIGISVAQKTWLENELKNTDKNWKIVCSHIELPDDVKAIVEKYGVVIAFSGHEHFYKHSKPMLSGVAQSMTVSDSDETLLSNQLGTTYVTNSTTGGADSWGSVAMADDYLCAFGMNDNLGAIDSSLALGDLGTVKNGWGMYSVISISENILKVSVYIRNSTTPNTPFTLLHTYGFELS